MHRKFKYTWLESDEERSYVKSIANEIRSLLLPHGSRMPGERYWTIGELLLDIKPMMPKRAFYDFIYSELDMSTDVAYCFMRIVTVFKGRKDALMHVPYTTLYALTSSSYPSFILERIEAGGYVPSLDRIQEIRAKKVLPHDEKQETSMEVQIIDVLQVVDALKDAFKVLSERCYKSEQERDMLKAGLRKLYE